MTQSEQSYPSLNSSVITKAEEELSNFSSRCTTSTALIRLSNNGGADAIECTAHGIKNKYVKNFGRKNSREDTILKTWVTCNYICLCSFVCCILFERGVFFVCLIVVPLPTGKTPFAVKINNNKKDERITLECN
jgi:hypothetical protein